MPKTPYKRGSDYVLFCPDRVAIQDATAQMALLQFMQAGKKVAVPSTVHCDHLILAQDGAQKDLTEALKTNKKCMILTSVSNKYGIGLETWCRNYSSSCFRKLCGAGWFIDRYRFSYCKCGWTGYGSCWCWWS